MDSIIKILMAFLGTLGFAGIFNLPKKTLLPAAVGGMLAWSMYMLVGVFCNVEFICYFAGGFAVTVYSEILARAVKVPVTVFLVPGAIPLVPGGSLYHAMEYVIKEEYYNAVGTAYQTASYACAIAAGIIIAMGFFTITTKSRRI